MKRLLMLVLSVVLVVSLFGCSQEGANETTSTPTTVEPTLSEAEIHLSELLSGYSVAENNGTDLVVTYKGVKSATVSGNSTLDSLKEFLSAEDKTDLVMYKYSVEDPNIIDVAERLTYTASVNNGDTEEKLWSFFADSLKESGALKWVELDPAGGYAGSCDIALNGITLSNDFKSVLETLGKPNTCVLSLRESKPCIIASWYYDSYVMYVNFMGYEGNELENATVHDIYMNFVVNSN